MKDKLKEAIDMLAVPGEEKEEIFCRVTDQKSRKKYKTLQKKSVAVAAGLILILLMTNWNRIYSMAQSTWVAIRICVGNRPKNDIWGWNGVDILGSAVLAGKEYQIPENMEKKTCLIKHIWVKIPDCVRSEDEEGEYHYLQKRYDTLNQARQELKLPVLELFPGEKRERETTLVICEELEEKPAVLLTKYLPQEGQKNLFTLRITAFGGNIEGYKSEGRTNAGEYFIENYVTESGIEAYIFSNRFTRSEIECFNFYEYRSGDGRYRERKEWEMPTRLLVPVNCYQALIFHDGIKYEITGADSLKEMEEVLETLQ